MGVLSHSKQQQPLSMTICHVGPSLGVCIIYFTSGEKLYFRIAHVPFRILSDRSHKIHHHPWDNPTSFENAAAGSSCMNKTTPSSRHTKQWFQSLFTCKIATLNFSMEFKLNLLIWTVLHIDRSFCMKYFVFWDFYEILVTLTKN